jgi:polysaccharide biosynthesis/export protein
MRIVSQTSRFQTIILASVILMVATSCTTPLRKITYLNKIRTGVTYWGGPTLETYKIRSNDLLYIHVIGDDPASVAFLNLIPTTYGGGGYSENLDLVTFIVDETGDIYYPQFGKIHVEGQTVDQIREELQGKVNQYMENTSVFVKLVNRTITVLGEVRAPGQHEMAKNQFSIFEAIGTAGDITDFGNRRDVKLIRETPSGKEVISIDLTNPKLVSSPYYYVLPNDILYIEPTTKVYGRKTMAFGTGFSLLFSTISTALLLINYFK